MPKQTKRKPELAEVEDDDVVGTIEDIICMPRGHLGMAVMCRDLHIASAANEAGSAMVLIVTRVAEEGSRMPPASMIVTLRPEQARHVLASLTEAVESAERAAAKAKPSTNGKTKH